ncbi:hypothetical protein B0T13DRAFT_481850 [Neurospora crassa]|nr:hypothetical protein B0T13DRAFT_481850 [Neurospora crassa]
MGGKEGGEVVYVDSAHDVTSGPSSRGSSRNSRSISTRENTKSYHSPVVWVASTNNLSTAESGRTHVASRSTMATSAIKLSDYEDESVYNDDGVNGGLPSSSRGGSLMEGRTALSPPPPPIPPRARSRSRSAPKEAPPAPPAAAESFPFAPANPVLPAPTPITTAASVLLSPFPPRPKSIRTGVGTGPVKLKDRQNSADEAMGVGYAVSYNSAIPPPPVRAAPPAPPKWAPPTIPGYEDDAKPLSSSGFKLDDPPRPPPSEKRETGSNNRNNRLSIFPGPSPSPTPSTQGWSSSPLSSPSTPPVPTVPTDRLEASEHGSQHKRGGSGGTAEAEEEIEEDEKRGRPFQKRQQQQTQTRARARGSSVTGQSPSPAPTLEAWLKRGMSSTRVPVRRRGTETETETGIVAGLGASPSSSLPRSASTSNLAAVRRQSYTARLREQVQQRYMLDADDGGRGEDWPIRQS